MPSVVTTSLSAPECFTHCNSLTVNMLRRETFAVWAESVETWKSSLQTEDFCGVIVTSGDSVRLSSLSLTLYHLEVPRSKDEQIPDLLNTVFPLLETLFSENDRIQRIELTIQRTKEDRLRMVSEFQNIREVLYKEIADRRAIENELLLSEERLRIISDSVNDAIFIHDAVSGDIIWVNLQATKLFGMSNEKICSKKVAELSAENTPEIQQAAMKLISDTASGKVQRLEWQAKACDGHLFWTELVATPILLDNKTRVLVNVRDITERKKRDKERIQLMDQMLHAQKLESLGVLAGGIAHDFNNLLTAIIGNTNLISFSIPRESVGHDYLKAINNASCRAADLCKQLLAYAGKGKFTLTDLNINDLANEMGQILSVSISKKAVLNYELDKDIPFIEADPTQIRQIMMNLIVNASDALQEHPGSITVKTGVKYCDKTFLKQTMFGNERTEGNYVFLEVSDTGCGMSQEMLDRIFEPFFTTKFTGRGLGLAALIGIVRGHNGSVLIKSELNKGTTFTVFFPVSESIKKEIAIPVNINPQWRGSGLVLLVDDEITVRTVTAKMLEKLGFTVKVACDGSEGVLQFKELIPQKLRLVLLDLTMPKLDGTEVLKYFREIAPQIPVLAISGYTELEIAKRFKAKGGPEDFLQKPFQLIELKNKVAILLP